MKGGEKKKDCKLSLRVLLLCQNFIPKSKNMFINIELTSHKKMRLK